MANQTRATVFENVQIGVESLAAPGVIVSATTRLQALGFMVSPKVETSRFRPSGTKYDTVTILGKDWTEYAVDGRLDYDNARYLFSSVIGAAAITTVGTNGRVWTYTSRSNAPDVLQTYTVDTGSFVRASRASNVIFTGCDISFKRDDATISGAAIGKNMIDPIYLTGSAVYTLSFTGTVSGGTFTLTYSAQTTTAIPYNATAAAVEVALWNLSTVGPGNVNVTGGPGPASYVVQFTGALADQAITLTGSGAALTGTVPVLVVTSTQTGVAITTQSAVPVIPGDVSIYADATFGALGTTKLLRVLEATVSIGSRVAPLWAINASEDSFTATLETVPDVTLKLKMEADSAGMAYLTAMRAAATTYFFRIESVGPNLPSPAVSGTYLFRWDMACQIESPDSMGDSDGAFTVDWTFRTVQSSLWGKAMNIVLQNMATAL